MIQTIASTSEDYLVLYSIEKCTKRQFYIVSSQAAPVCIPATSLSHSHSVMGGQLGLLGHMGPSTVGSRYCSANSNLGFVRDKIRSLRDQVSHSI